MKIINTLPIGGTGGGDVNLDMNPVIIGEKSTATSATNTVAIGINSWTTLINGTAIGINANSTSGVAIGANPNTTTGVSIGTTASATTGVSIGTTASVTTGIAIGTTSKATTGVSLGISSNSSTSSIAIGQSTNASGTYSVSAGYNVRSTATNSIAIGRNASTASSSTNGIAIGTNVSVSDIDSIAIGGGIATQANNSVTLGFNSSATANRAIAIGFNVASGGVAIGYNSTSSSGSSTAMGSHANASQSSVAIGTSSIANKNQSCALGPYAEAIHLSSTALGYDAITTASSSIQLGSNDDLSALYCRRPITTTSDARDKTDFKPISSALDFITKLNPITYVDNDRSLYFPKRSDMNSEELNNIYQFNMIHYNKSDHASGRLKGERARAGLLAQEVKAAIDEIYKTDNYADIVSDNYYDYIKDGVEIPEGLENRLSITYTTLIPFLIAAVKELNTKYTNLEESYNNLNSEFTKYLYKYPASDDSSVK